MSLLQIIYYSGHCEIVSGDAKYLFDLIGGLSPDQYEIVLFTDKNPAFEKRAQSDWWTRSKDVPILYLDTRPRLFFQSWYKLFSWMSPLNFFVFWRSFSSKKSYHKKTIFHFNNGGYPGKTTGLWALFAAKILNMSPIFMTVHNVPLKRKWYRPDIGFLYDMMMGFCVDHIICASENIRLDLIKRGFSPESISTIYCGLPDGRSVSEEEIKACRDEHGAKDQDVILGMCANLDMKSKGFWPLMESFSQLCQSYEHLFLWIAGGGSEESLNGLKEYAGQLGILHRTIFLGPVDDIHRLNLAFDIAVVPSISLEATPYTIKEASRAYRPVVTTTSGGCPYGVRDQETGLIVEAGDVLALTSALRVLIEDPELRKNMGRKGYEFFKERFELKVAVKAHEQLYKSK